MQVSLATIAQWINGQVFGDTGITITQLCGLDAITRGGLVFVDNKKHLAQAEASEAAAMLVNKETHPTQKPYIQVQNPTQAFIQLLQIIHPTKKENPGIHPTAVIAADVIIAENVSIGPYVTIGEGSRIENDCVIKSHVAIGTDVRLGQHVTLHPHVTIYDKTCIDEHVTIHAGTVIGSDGFGYKWIDGKHQKFPHIGHVHIHKEVEIGALTAIDRASLEQTTIGEGTKIDNLVQIAHSVQLGKHNILCAFTGVAGSTISGDRVICAANVGISDHVHIDDDVVLGARAGVPPHKHLIRGNLYLGTPARPKEKMIETELAVTRLPFMRKNIKNLSEKIDALSKRIEQLAPITEE